MPSPFPGMDPYVERPAIFPDFHDTYISALKAQLQPLLRPRFAAVTRNRLVVVAPDRPILPDVAIVRDPAARSEGRTVTATLEVDAPVIFEQPEQHREPYLEIIEPALGERVVTAIEVVSPDNKAAGEGRESYLRKRQELWNGGANLVEIDLLRARAAVVNLTRRQLRNLRPWHYLVVVTRCPSAQRAAYAVSLQQRLPRIAIPLDDKTPEVPLDLQAAFTRSWDESAYPALLRYASPPPGRMSPDDMDWCDGVLRTAGMRTTTNDTSGNA